MSVLGILGFAFLKMHSCLYIAAKDSYHHTSSLEKLLLISGVISHFNLPQRKMLLSLYFKELFPELNKYPGTEQDKVFTVLKEW